MRRQVDLLPIEYCNRPAFRLLIGCAIGALLFKCNLLIAGTLLLALLSIIGIALCRKHPYAEPLVWIFIVSILFGWYTHIRAQDWGQLPKGITLYDVPIRIKYPISSSAERLGQFRAEVLLSNGSWLPVLLRSHNPLPEELTFGSCGTADIDLSAVRVENSNSYSRYLVSEGYCAEGYIQSLSTLKTLETTPIMSHLQKWRSDLVRQFANATEGLVGKPYLGIIYALSLGDRSWLPREVKNNFSTSGVSHILAVSGYHLGVVLGIVSLLFGQILWRFQARRWRYLLIFISLLAYTLFTGASTATVRAMIMVSIGLLSRILSRPIDPIQILSLTVLVFLIANPFAYYSIGLLLSIAAVWGIYSFVPLFRYYLNPRTRWLSWITDLISVTIAAQLGVFPLLLKFFGSFSLGFIWSNIPVVLISSLLIPLSLLGFILVVLFGQLPTLYIGLLNMLVTALDGVTNFFASVNIPLEIEFDSIAILLYYGATYFLYRWLFRQVTRATRAKENSCLSH